MERVLSRVMGGNIYISGGVSDFAPTKSLYECLYACNFALYCRIKRLRTEQLRRFHGAIFYQIHIELCHFFTSYLVMNSSPRRIHKF